MEAIPNTNQLVLSDCQESLGLSQSCLRLPGGIKKEKLKCCFLSHIKLCALAEAGIGLGLKLAA